MAKLNETQLMMILKSFSRADNIPLDASSVWDTKAEAEAYAKQAERIWRSSHYGARR